MRFFHCGPPFVPSGSFMYIVRFQLSCMVYYFFFRRFLDGDGAPLCVSCHHHNLAAIPLTCALCVSAVSPFLQFSDSPFFLCHIFQLNEVTYLRSNMHSNKISFNSSWFNSLPFDLPTSFRLGKEWEGGGKDFKFCGETFWLSIRVWVSVCLSCKKDLFHQRDLNAFSHFVLRRWFFSFCSDFPNANHFSTYFLWVNSACLSRV